MQGKRSHPHTGRRLLPEKFQGKRFPQDGKKHEAFRAEGWEGSP